MAETGLKQKAIQGTIWSAIQKFGISFISFLSNILLARLLSPDDYGCIGMLAIFLVISNTFILGGFVSALIQKKEVTDLDYNTVFYWNIIVAIIAYLILFFAAPSISDYYHIEKLAKILRVQGIVLILNGFSAIQTTRLRKQLRFDILAKVNITSSILSVALAILLAFCGKGVWALVFQQIAYSAINSIILWTLTDWHPSLLFSVDSFKRLFGFGFFMLLSELLNSLCDNIQGLIIGRKFTSSTMGYYAQAKKLEEVPTVSISQLVAQVTFPLFSKIQDEKDRMRIAVKSTLSLMNYVNFAMMSLMLVVARPLILILYTDKWENCIVYFQILCISGLFNCMQSVNYQATSAAGRSRELLIWNFFKRTIGVVLMLIGLHWGVIGLLWGMVLSSVVTYVVNAVVATPSTNYSLVEQLKDSFPLLMMAAISSVCTYFAGLLQVPPLLMLFIQCLAYGCIYLLLSAIFRRPELKEIIDIISRLFHKPLSK